MTAFSEADLQQMADTGLAALDAGDNDRAIEKLLPVAQWGDPGSMFNVAIAFMRKGDVDSSVRWYREAALTGDVDAMAYLGQIFKLVGDRKEATNWYLMAAQKGNQNAASALRLLSMGDDTPVAAITRRTSAAMGDAHSAAGRTSHAVEAWMAAADAGDATSMYRVGQVHERERNLGVALLWFNAAARSGSQEARQRLGHPS